MKTEDDTFKMLRGLTASEARAMYLKLYAEAMKSSTTFTVGDVHNYVDVRLRKYGWTMDIIDVIIYGRL